jgi:SAM-dependent methyltransferase
MVDYVHGYSNRENDRLQDQANTLAELLHYDTIYPANSHVLEVGCGVGAQTVIVAGKNPQTHFTSIDISNTSLEIARAAVEKANLTNVKFCQSDLFHLPFVSDSFDHVFVCFVLEHLTQPLEALENLKNVLKPGGTLTVIEGDHDSAYYHPRSSRAQRTIDCLVQVQGYLGGDALIGRQLYPLLKQSGWKNIHVEPRQVYADPSRPNWVEGFTKNTFIAMVEGVKETAIEQGLINLQAWEAGISDLYATTKGTFCYTFFKGKANRQ